MQCEHDYVYFEDSTCDTVWHFHCRKCTNIILREKIVSIGCFK